MIQTQFQTQIKLFRTDNGTEYFNTILGDYFQKHGIIHQSSYNNTPQQNRIAERKNKHILQVARALMFSINMPIRFLGNTVLTATFLINRMPSHVLSFHTPLKQLTTNFPHQKLGTTLPLKVFGCTAFVHIHSHARSKLDPRACKCVFIGYSPVQKGYKCYDPAIKRVFFSWDVTFFEGTPFFPKTSLQEENMDEACFLETNCSMNPESVPEPVNNPESVPGPINNPENSNTESIPTPHSSMPPLEGNLDLGGDAGNQNAKEMLVYSRRPKSKYKEHLTSEAPRDSELMIGPDTLESLNMEPIDLDLPIALTKPKQSCTPHPISKFLSYKAFSSNF